MATLVSPKATGTPIFTRKLSFDPDLPISARRADIAAAIRDHQVVIVCGETGSGKSTQLPKICLEMGRGIGRPDRSYPAAADRRAERGRTHRGRNRLALGPRRRLQGPLLRSDRPAMLDQAHDRRHPAGRDAERSPLRALRHDHPRRGPRTVAERRFPHRLPETAAAQAARPAADHHLGDDRRRPLRRPFFHGGRSRRR